MRRPIEKAHRVLLADKSRRIFVYCSFAASGSPTSNMNFCLLMSPTRHSEPFLNEPYSSCGRIEDRKCSQGADGICLYSSGRDQFEQVGRCGNCPVVKFNSRFEWDEVFRLGTPYGLLAFSSMMACPRNLGVRLLSEKDVLVNESLRGCVGLQPSAY